MIGYSAFRYCSSLTSITVDSNNSAYKTINGNLYTKDGKTLIQYAIGKNDSSFIIPDSVTTISAHAFYYCSSLTSVVIGDRVTAIGSSAFEYCSSLTSVVIPDSVTTIGSWAFSSCSSLKTINYRGTVKEWNAISKGSPYKPSGATVVYNYTE